jgi:UDP-N-acetyl-D-mannosaminuronic acid transferase (WecB/TagA/CpsF family)
MEKGILHSSYYDRVIRSQNELVGLLDEDEFILSYVNLNNFCLEAMVDVTAFIVDSSVLAKAVDVQCMSPDYSSVMGELLSKSDRIMYIGGCLDENVMFINKQKKLFPSSEHKGLSGYGIELKQYIVEVSKFAPDTIVISLGYELQESLGSAIKRSGFRGKIICSGAFLSQESRADKTTYYPKWIVKLNLRWLFRLFIEKTARKRVPRIVLNYLKMKALVMLILYKKFLGNS